MGLWWKDVKEIPKGGILINGDPNAWSKWNPFWRFQHRWRVCRIDIDDEPYHVYFDDGVNKMVYQKSIKTKYFAVRIGPQDLVFSAVTDSSDPESLEIILISPERSYTWLEIYLLDEDDEITII